MNFLAHVFLSGNNENLILGNLIADSVKGKMIDLFADVVVLKCTNCCHIKTYMSVEEAFYDLFGDKSREEF